MIRIHLLLFTSIFSLSFQEGYTQTRPSTTIDQTISGICAGCQITNADQAWDNNPVSFTSMEVNLAGVGGRGEVTYGFSDPVSLNSTLKMRMQFGGGSILTGLASTEIFSRLSIQLLDGSGTVLSTYTSTNTTQVDVISTSDNIFEITIINPDAATQRVKILSGDLLSVGLTSRDLFIYDILQVENSITPVSVAEADGVSGTLLCIGCTVQNETHATSAFDMNSSYANYSIPLSLDLGSGYVYSRYSWGGTEYDGNDYDIYLVMENAELLTLGTELLFFEDNNISVAVTYGDASVEVFKFGNGSLISANLLGVGSGKFYLKIDADDSKTIQKVEPRFGGNLAGLLSNLRLYSIFVTETSEDPFLVDDTEAVATVEAALRVDEYVNSQTLVTINDTDGAIVSAALTGTLPTGTALDPVSGEITVSDIGDLQDGSFTVTVGTTDNTGGTSEVEVTIFINPADQEAVYTINPAQPVDDYLDNDVLGTVADADGAVTAAIVSSGSLPAGVSLGADGTLEVSDASLLVDGSYDFSVTTTDENGGTTDSDLTLIFSAPDQEAVYTINPSLPVSDYEDDDILATVTDADGVITAAIVSSGSLPAGVQLESDGTLSVSDANLMVSGSYDFSVTTTDADGNTTNSDITLIFSPVDQEAVFTVADSKPVDQYANGEVLASASDADGLIVSANVISGSLPAGTSISANGTITVSDVGILTPGTTMVGIETVDDFGGLSENIIAIVIDGIGDIDQEAVYTLDPSKPVNDYIDEEVIATVSDADGAITNASISAGLLPSGTRLETDGTIVIDDASLLIDGNYSLVVTTTDAPGGTTASSISLQLNPSDIEAIYTLTNSKPVNQYLDGDTVALATDVNGDIITAIMNSGSLPDGIQLEADGTLTVADASQLVAGATSFSVTTTDEKGGATDSNITITFFPADLEATVTVSPPKPENEYTNGDTLAMISDLNGDIINTIVDSGLLPNGVTLAADGTITVTDSTAVVAGDYTITLITTDENGGTTVVDLTLVIGPADTETIYTIDSAKPFNDYLDDEVIATVTDPDGEIVQAIVDSGSLPPGISLNTDGTITVNDTSQLVSGTYTFSVITTDEQGGTSENIVTLQFNTADQEAIYIVYEAKRVAEYGTGNMMADVSDADGRIIVSLISDGTLPTGVELQTDGTIQVSDTSVLVAGSYFLTIITTDTIGGISENNVTLTIKENDKEAVYTLLPTKPLQEYVAGEVVASVSDENGPIVSAVIVEGTLPPGTVLQTDGTIQVSDSASLEATEASITVTTTDAEGGVTTTELMISFISVDQEAMYSLIDAIPVDEIKQGDTLAIVSDPDGTIIEASITAGVIPSGTELLDNGIILVSDTALLEVNTYTVSIITEDELGGTTQHTLEPKILPASPDNVAPEYDVQPPTDGNQYLPGDTIVVIVYRDTTITEVIVEQNELPPGTVMDEDGNIIVENPDELEPGNYYVTIVYVFENGEMVTQEIPLTIDNPAQAVNPLPALSPNDDGVNDYWKITNIEAYPDNVVRIFNRWGEAVFTQEGYDNESQSWNGSANMGARVGSGLLPKSTYFFILDLKNGERPVTGYIVLKY
ncbi:MAG: gliding motility-associated C-terminal domain-containing protein [Cyclobacteriaceae bacterium]